MLQLQTNYSAINVRWAALQAQLDAYQLSSVTWSFTFAKLNTFSRSWFQSDSWKSSPSIKGEVCWGLRGKKKESRGDLSVPSVTQESDITRVEMEKGGKLKNTKVAGATSTCGFTGTQKVRVYRWVEHLSLSLSFSLYFSLSLIHTHTHLHSLTLTHRSFQPDVWLRYDIQECVEEGDDRRFTDRHFSRLHHQPDECLQTDSEAEKGNKYDFKWNVCLTDHLDFFLFVFKCLWCSNLETLKALRTISFKLWTSECQHTPPPIPPQLPYVKSSQHISCIHWNNTLANFHLIYIEFATTIPIGGAVGCSFRMQMQ